MHRFSNPPEPEATDWKAVAGDWPYLLALALLGAVLFVYRLGAPGLMDPDEGRYAEIAREMIVYKDWIIPQLNAVPYLEKPPLVYWLTALSFKVLGYTELAARLPASLSALGGVFLAYYLGRVLWGPTPAFLAATVLASCAGYVAMGRLLTLDMTFALLLNAGVGLGYLALSRGRRRLWPWAYLALGLAVLTKGPVAVILSGLIWGLWVLWQGESSATNIHTASALDEGNLGGLDDLESAGILTDSGKNYSPKNQPSNLNRKVASEKVRGWLGAISRRPWRAPLVQPWGWLILAAVALPWFIVAQLRYPEFFDFFILQQHFGRYLTPAIHPQPFYYYLPILLGFMLPWSWLLWWVLFSGGPWDRDRRFLLIWAGAVVLFFSLSRGKLPPYILPALLPLALFYGHSLYAALAGQPFNNRWLWVSCVVWSLAGVALAALYLIPPASLGQALSRSGLGSPAALVLVLIFALTPILALIWRKMSVLILGALLLSAAIPGIIDQVSLKRSPRELGLALKTSWQPGAALVGVGLYSQAMSFYSGQIFHLLYCRTELDFGLRLRPDSQLCLADGKELAVLAQTRSPILLLVKEKDVPGVAPDLPGKLERLGHHKDCLLLSYRGKY